MSAHAQRFVIADGRTHWAAARTSGVDPNPAGEVALAQIPAPAEGGVDLPGPFAPRLEGFTVSPCGEIAFALPAERKFVLVDTRCADRRFVLEESACPGEVVLSSVSGLASGGGRLYAADKSSARVAIFALPGLELVSSWGGNVGSPARVGVDGDGRVYILDTELMKLLRLDSDGRPDATTPARWPRSQTRWICTSPPMALRS